MSDSKPTQAHVEQALLALRPDATWAPHFVFGVSVRRLDRPGGWYNVGMYEGDVLREGDGGVLDLMDAAHAIRIGLGRYQPRFEQTTCEACVQTMPGGTVSMCPVCVMTVCGDCHNMHADSHADCYAQMAHAVDTTPASPPRAARVTAQLEIAL